MKSQEEKLVDEPNESWYQLLKVTREQLSQQISQTQLQQISPTALAY
ncbi:hypothetical protein [Aetokthonos hydrillicola]